MADALPLSPRRVRGRVLSKVRGRGTSALLRRLLPGAAAAWATWACGEGGAGGRLDVGSSREVVVGELVRELPSGGVLSDDLVLETARGFDLFGDTVAIADRVAGRVQLFRSDGEHIATLGGPAGPGDPEVLQSPWRVEFAPDGALWVGDPGRGALVRFPPGGCEPRTVRLPVPSTAGGFGVDHVLGPVGPSVEPRFLLTAYAVADRPLNIPSEVPLPAELAYEASWMDRIAPLSLVVSGGRKGEVVLLDAMRTILWRIELEYEPPRIVRISRIPVPRWLVESTRAEMERIVDRSGGRRVPALRSGCPRDGAVAQPRARGGLEQPCPGRRGVAHVSRQSPTLQDHGRRLTTPSRTTAQSAVWRSGCGISVLRLRLDAGPDP